MSVEDSVDATTFILRHTRLLPAPFVPEIVLYQGTDMLGLWQQIADRGESAPPPYWAFPWAGGQALARYILDHPDVVKGKTVLDLGTGSGLCALAALRAGAARVKAVDIEPFCAVAVARNAAANGVAVAFARADLLRGSAPEVDIILAGDVCYEQPFADRALAWLVKAHRRGVLVLMGDPSRAHFPRELMMKLAQYDVPTPAPLEAKTVTPTSVYAFAAPL